MQLPSLSRFKLTDPVQVDGGTSFGLMKKYSFLDNSNLNDDQIIKFKIDANTAHRPDLIANQFYGSPQLLWVVILFNKPKSIFRWPEIGEIINLPSKNSVLPYI